ncbi:MAG: xanthine dehydrogenase family protein subunit M [Chloroflexi bacterium]|nr:MAG: xanthine dehydrogenase family protein subunit M [Chloroflexota bacterium]
MLPAAFDYRAPASLTEALAILKQHGDEAKVMAGGQSLIPLLKLRFSRPELVVDIARIPDLNTIKREDADGHFAIGALARHVDIENSKELAIAAPMLAEAAHWIADPLVRNRGTLVGSICHADPAGDWGSVVLAFGADIVATSQSGQRVIHAQDFFQGPFLDGGKIAKAGIGLTAVGDRNIKAADAELYLHGKEPTDAVIAEAARLAAETAEPKDDARGSAAYKKDVVRVFVQRGLKTAVGRAREAR